MGIQPECAHHEEGPGQNEIDFRYSDPLSAADNAVTFKYVVGSIVARAGLVADFSPKPLKDQAGNGMHINISVKASDGADYLDRAIAGIMEQAKAMTLFLNPLEDSYRRLGSNKAPGYVSWSSQNRSQLIRIPAASEDHYRAELRSPDPSANPYIAYALLIKAALHGISNELELPGSEDINLFTADSKTLERFDRLPLCLEDAKMMAEESVFIRDSLPESVIRAYCER